MSTNAMVHGNRASSKKGKIFLTDIEILKKNEIQRRRALRLLQVRQQCKDIASQLRERCKDEKSKQLRFYELDLQEELRENEIMRQAILRQQYQHCLSSVGQSHRDAAAQPDPETVLLIDRQRWKKEADRRGDAALKLHKARTAAAAQKQEEAEKQRNFVRTVENIRSTVVASLPKKVSYPSGGSKGRETKSKVGKKAPLRDVNKIPVPIPPSSDVFMLVPTHPDEPLMQQGTVSQSSSSISLGSVSQRPPCIDKFVNKLASRLGSRGSTVDSLSSVGSVTSENRTLSAPSSDALPLQLANSTQVTLLEQKKISEPDKKKQTARSVTFSSPSDEKFAENLVETDIQTVGTSKPSGSKSAALQKDTTSHKSLYAGETLLTGSLKQVQDALKRSTGQGIFRKSGSMRGPLLESDVDECISKSSSHSVLRDTEDADEAVGSSVASKGKPLHETSKFMSHLPTVWNDSVSNRFSCPRGLDVIEEERVDEEAQLEAPVNVDARKQIQRRENETEDFPSEEQMVNVVNQNSNETQADLGGSETSSRRVQLYDHTHRFKHVYDASSSISVTRLIRDGENDARTEAAAVESAAGAANDAASSAAIGRAAETSAILSAPYPAVVPMGMRGREALRRQRLEREYQNLLSALGVLSREERISRTVAGFGNPVEAHISDARLKERHAERQHIISSAFQNVVGDVEAFASYKSPMSPPVKLPASNVNVAEPVPVTGQGDGAQLTAKQFEADSPAAALNVGMWTTLPVSTRGSVATIPPSPKPPSTPSSSENSIILVPPHPSIPSTPLSPVQEMQSIDAEKEVRHYGGAMPKEDFVAKVEPTAKHVEDSTGPSIRDLEALEGLLERVRQQRDRLLAGTAEPSQLPPLPPSPPPPPPSAGPGDSASADVSASSVEAQSPPSPPPPPLPPQTRPRPPHRPRHAHPRAAQAEGATADEGRGHRPEATSAPTPAQHRQEGALPRREGGHRAGRGPEHRRRRAGGRDGGREEQRGLGRSRSAAASLSPSQRARELSVDVAVKSEGAVCGCFRPRDGDAMRLRVSLTGDGDAGDGARRRRHHRHRHAHHDAACPHRKPPPPSPPRSSGDSQPPPPSPRQSPATSPAPASRSRTPQPRSPGASKRGAARPPPPPPQPPPLLPTPPLRSPRASPQRPPSRPPCPCPAAAPCTKRRKSPKRSPRARPAHKKTAAAGATAARSPAKRGPAASGPAPCWSERLGRTPPWRADDSASTLYLSPPDQLHAADLEALVGLLRCRAVPVVCAEGECQRGGGGGGVPAGPTPLDPLLESYVTRLLAMSQANVEALNVSSSDVSLSSEVLGHPLNTACRAGEERAEPRGTPAPAPTPASSPAGSPGQRSVGVEVTPEDLDIPCAECAPCARHPREPCVAPPPKRTADRACSPAGSPACLVHPDKPRPQARLPACAAAAASKFPAHTSSSPSPPVSAAHQTMRPHGRSCSPVCPPSCAASTPSPAALPPRTAVAAGNSPSAPLDTTEYLQHALFTRGAFRRVPASAPAADPALPHDSPDYRPLRVGGGDRDSSPSASWCACDAARPLAPPPQRSAPAPDDAWQCAAADVAEMSQRCARRIESLARLIEHVRSEKSNLAGLQATPSDASSSDGGRSPAIWETPRHNRPAPAPTCAPVRTRTRTPPRSRPPARSPGREKRVEWSPGTPTEAADGGNETWFQRLQRQSPPSAGQQRSPPRPGTAPQGSARPPASPTRLAASSPSPPRARTPPGQSPKGRTSPRRRSPEPPGQHTSPRRPASSPPQCSSPSGVCAHVCPGTVVVSPRAARSPPASPTRSPPMVSAPPDEGLVGAGEDNDTLWVFAPGSWPPCPGAWGRVLRPKPPPAMWRPGVPYVQQHELSAIPEADVSQSVLEGEGSERRSPAQPPPPPPPPPPPHSPLVFGTVTGEAAEFSMGPRENLHGLLIATHLAAQRGDPWLPPESLPFVTSASARPFTHAPPSPSPGPPHSQDSPPVQSDFLPCSYPFPPPCAVSPQIATTPPRSGSPEPVPPPCSPPCSPGARCSPRVAEAEQQEDENDPDIVAELIRRGVLRSPFSWMKSAESGPQIDVDVDVSVMSGASSDFVSDLLISGSSSTPRKAQRSSPDSPEQQQQQQQRRQRGGADTAFDPSHEASSKQQLADDILRQTMEDSGTLETLPEDLEGMFERLGLGWAASMLRKTQEAMAISSSSSEASRGASRPGGGGGSGGDNNSNTAPGGGNGTNLSAVASTRSVPRRGHSTPADASAASDGSGSVSWAHRQVVFTGDSDMSSVVGVSSRDLSTPTASLVKSKSKHDNVT